MMIKMLFSSLMAVSFFNDGCSRKLNSQLVDCNAFIPILLTELNKEGTNDLRTYGYDGSDPTEEMPTVFINDFHATNNWAVAKSLESVLETLIDDSIPVS